MSAAPDSAVEAVKRQRCLREPNVGDCFGYERRHPECAVQAVRAFDMAAGVVSVNRDDLEGYITEAQCLWPSDYARYREWIEYEDRLRAVLASSGDTDTGPTPNPNPNQQGATQ